MDAEKSSMKVQHKIENIENLKISSFPFSPLQVPYIYISIYYIYIYVIYMSI